MKKAGKLLSILFSVMIVVSAMTATVQAAAIEQPAAQAAGTDIQPHADVIVTKYRAYQGKLQKRRWNETRGYWVDPYWITIGTQV